MSNALAIATVTATIKEVLQENATYIVPGSEVTTLRPQSVSNPTTDNARINIYLYQIVPNVALRTADLPTRRRDGTLIQLPQSAWDLHYLFSFYGDDSALEAQRLLGSTVDILHSQPFLSRSKIRNIISSANNNGNNQFLAESNLDEQVESIKFVPLVLNLEELSKIWSVFFQTTYDLSVAYQASVVLIESRDIARPALPVRDRNIYVVGFRQPVITRILSQSASNQPFLSYQPILTGHRLRIEGSQLRGGQGTQIRIDQTNVTLDPNNISDRQIDLVLDNTVTAGVKGLQVVQTMKISTPERDYGFVESNIAAFILRPTITGEVTVDTDPNNGNVLTVPVSPIIGSNQRVILLLNQLPTGNPADANLRAYSFVEASPDTDDSEIKIPVFNVQAGEYLIRLQVDGAESLLNVDSDNNSPTFNQYIEPTVTIRPTITGAVTVDQVPVNGNTQTVLTVPVNPIIGRNQQVILLLNQLTNGGVTDLNLQLDTFVAPSRNADTSAIAIPVSNLQAGEYLIRLQVDGVESLLTVDSDSGSPTFNQFIAPTVTIS